LTASSFWFFHPSFSLSPPSHSQQKFPKTCRPVSSSCPSFPAFSVLASISLLITPIPSFLSCPFCRILPVFPSCPTLFASFFLPYHSCPNPPVLYFNPSYPLCLITPVLSFSASSFLPYHSCPIFPILYFLPYPSCLFTPVLSFPPHPSPRPLFLPILSSLSKCPFQLILPAI
jgi:hypothetical protein